MVACTCMSTMSIAACVSDWLTADSDIICVYVYDIIDDTPCEITDQLAVGTQNCFSTLFYTPYTNIKTSAQNAPKFTIARQKKFCGGGTASSPTGEGDTPSPYHTPSAPSAPRLSRLRRSAFPFLFIYDSNTGYVTV